MVVGGENSKIEWVDMKYDISKRMQTLTMPIVPDWLATPQLRP